MVRHCTLLSTDISIFYLPDWALYTDLRWLTSGVDEGLIAGLVFVYPQSPSTTSNRLRTIFQARQISAGMLGLGGESKAWQTHKRSSVPFSDFPASGRGRRRSFQPCWPAKTYLPSCRPAPASRYATRCRRSLAAGLPSSFRRWSR